MFKNKLNYQLLNILMVAVIIYLGLTTMDYWLSFILRVFHIVLPFIIAFAIAYALYPLVRKLKEKGLNNGLSVAIVAISIVFIFVGVVALTIPLVYEQLISLSKMVGDVITDLSTKFEINLGDFQASIDGILNTVIHSVGQYVSNGTVDFVGKSIDFITQFIIIAIVSVYFLVDMEKIRKNIKELLQEHSKRSFRYVQGVDRELGNYLQGLMLFMIIQLIEYSFLFRIVNHPNWLLLGILASVTTVIPYFGGLITNIIAVILASVVSTPVFIATLVICFVFPNIDGYIISPRVYNKTNNVDPLWSIFAVSVGGSLFGLMGIVISLPLYIILRSTFAFYRKDIYHRIEEIKKDK